jgi:transposase
LPKEAAARTRMAEAMGEEGAALVTVLYKAAPAAALRRLPAVETLRQVWVQQFVQEEKQRAWRAVADLPPGAVLIVSPHDVEARASIKRDTHWTGYKVHLTETCDADLPQLVTAVHTTPATTPDALVTAQVPAVLAQRDLLPAEHFLDSGSRSAALLVSSAAQGITLVGPVPPDTSWQARTPGG